ncbi:putative RING finger protein C6B12.07c [Exophiala dermatitidis]
MKFGQDYEAALSRGEYPPDWVQSAISYKKLKKCIKRVQRELLSLGLDKDTLDALWQHVGSGTSEAAQKPGEVLLHYSLDGNEYSFTPRLTIVIDPRDGSPMDAWLSPETRRNLLRLSRHSRASISSASGRRESADGQSRVRPQGPNEPNGTEPEADSVSDDTSAPDNDVVQPDQPQTIEVPLTSDSEFFQILRRELADLDHLQQAEQTRLQDEIVSLGNELRVIKSSKSKRSKEEVEAWRKILELYNDAEVFYSSHEADAGTRDAAHAQKQFQEFSKALSAQQRDVLKLGKGGSIALDRFLRINVKLLRFIKFQEINRTALYKIMKKFDKRTALHARSHVSDTLVKSPFIAQDLARATCFTISEEVLKVIPQLNDYLCPICFSISYKPIRLRCKHVFCVRCLVVMQREEQSHCPLCREEVVMEATSENLDRELLKFLKTNFKGAVKEKQRENEIQAGIDRWGAQYENSQKCVVM